MGHFIDAERGRCVRTSWERCKRGGIEERWNWEGRKTYRELVLIYNGPLSPTLTPPLQLTTLRSVIINKSGLFLDEEKPSLRRLLSQALTSLPPSVHQPSYLAVLYPTLLSWLSPLLQRLSGHASGLPLLPDPSECTQPFGVPQFDHIANCLEILDSFLLGRWATAEEQPQLYHDVINGNGQEDLAEMLSTLCAVCNIILRNSEFEDIVQTGNSFGHMSSFLCSSCVV